MKEQTRITSDIAETMTSTTIETGLSKTFRPNASALAKGSYLMPQGTYAVNALLLRCGVEKHRIVAMHDSIVIIFSIAALTTFVA